MVQRHPLRQSGASHECFARLSRRSWLIGAFLGVSGITVAPHRAWSMEKKEDASDDTQEIALVQAIAKKAGLGPFSNSHTEHFLGLGDADDRFRATALKICESLAPVFLQHFHDKGFKLALPKNRMTVITLKGRESYQAFTGEDPGTIGGGHYDLDTNRLVMFDFRPDGEEPAVVNDPRRVNLMTLVHETTHLLCFNTGLLSRQAAVPALGRAKGWRLMSSCGRKKRRRLVNPTARGWFAYVRQSRPTSPGFRSPTSSPTTNSSTTKRPRNSRTPRVGSWSTT